MKNDITMKKITVLFFLFFIFSVPIYNIFTEDKKVSEIENKVLTQLPELSIDSILSKRFMANFDEYTSDQFPLRTDLITFKNYFSYGIGNREFRNIYLSNNRLLEKFTLNKDIFSSNLDSIDSISKVLSQYNINSTLALIPTSIEFYKSELPYYAISDSQLNAISFAKEILSDSNIDNLYSPYDILYNNKDKYIFFNTDHHWTQLGAYLTYLDMFNYNYSEYDLYNNFTKVSDSFLGTYYSKVLLKNIEDDSIYSYDNFNNFNITIDFNKSYSTLYDLDKLKSKNQYQYFLHGDPAFAVIEGNQNINKELIIFKDSFAHCFIPFLCNEYSKIHVVDPRYYDIDLDKYLLNNKNITDALFFNNLQQMNTSIFYKFK